MISFIKIIDSKEMILVDDVENREFLRKLVDTMYTELPVRKKK